MLTQNNCLDALNSVRIAAREMNDAYLFKSRLNRLLAYCNEICSSGPEITRPSKPEIIEIHPGMNNNKREIAEIANAIFLQSRFLGQPSEPVTEEWQRCWDLIASELNRLEVTLTKYAAN